MLLALLLLGAGAARGDSCSPVRHEGAHYTVCEAHVGQDLRLFLDNDAGEKLLGFDALAKAAGKKIVFAMNAGMYLPSRAPVGLYIEKGEEKAKIITRDVGDNFGLLPNGVFCIGKGRFSVVESRAFAKKRPACDYATQSGPMLVIAGKLHPKFRADSQSVYIRNGVGVSEDGQTAYFAISDEPVTFHAFARLFQTGLGTPNALFLDGSISRLYAPELGRADFGVRLGPMVALLEE